MTTWKKAVLGAAATLLLLAAVAVVALRLLVDPERLKQMQGRAPEEIYDAMTIGIGQFRNARELRLDRMLLQPFRDDDRDYPLGRREPQD